MKRTYLAIFLWVTSAICGFSANGSQRLNIVFVLTDDLGWTDLGCCGSKYYETPNIDRLALQGMRFTDAYAACTVCSPSRACILTGQYPARLHVTDWIPGHARPFAKLNVPDWTMRLLPELPNLAKQLKSIGYATASIGKWHLGPEESLPTKVGFDLNIAGDHRGQPPSYFSPYKIETLRDEKDGEFLSDRLTDEALKFIEENQSRPFFLYLPHYAVHTPLMAKQAVVEKYKAKIDPTGAHKNPVYAALVESVDDSVGRLLSKLDELKLSEKTIVVFTSDNGGLIGPTSNVPLRAGKGSVYEGGVRVPLIVRWPGITKARSVSKVPVIGADFYPTFLAANGLEQTQGSVIDGEDITRVLRGDGPLKRDALYWHYPHYHPGGATPYGAIREGDWRLVEFFEDNRVELYQLDEDLGETHDLATSRPEKAAALTQKLHDWRARVGAQMPEVNANVDPIKDSAKRAPKGSR